MLYTNEQLRKFGKNYQQHKEAVERYLHKFNHPKEFRRLKFHEKDYLFQWMNTIQDDNGYLVYDLYKIPDANEYLFYKICLTYGEDVDSFSGVFYGPYGRITEQQLYKDKCFFDEYLEIWKAQLDEHKGRYLSILKPEIDRKLKELIETYQSGKCLTGKTKYCYAVFFWIYYRAKLFFSERNEKGLIFEELGYQFVANIYTFCHILVRHYVPSLNGELGASMNDNIHCIDINDFLDSIKNLIDSYFKVAPVLNTNKEYLLFKINNEKYIIWIKYKRLNELDYEEGVEIRSFYKCKEVEDLNKFLFTKDVELKKDIYCCI